jgi:hypothetical protein
LIRRRLCALFFLFVVLVNGAAELYVAAYAAERAGVLILPTWLRLDSPLCVPSFYNNGAVTECQCPRSAKIKDAPQGVPVAKPRRGAEVPLTSLMFPIPGSLAFKFLHDEVDLPSVRLVEVTSHWAHDARSSFIALTFAPETPPPRR